MTIYGFSIFDTLEKFSNCRYIDKPHLVATSIQWNINKQKNWIPKYSNIRWYQSWVKVFHWRKGITKTYDRNFSLCVWRKSSQIYHVIYLRVWCTPQRMDIALLVCIHSSLYFQLLSSPTPPPSLGKKAKHKNLFLGLSGWRFLDADMKWQSDKRGKISLECDPWSVFVKMST